LCSSLTMSWSQDPIDGGLTVCMSHNHNHSIYKVDNGSVFDMIESTIQIQGHKVAATTAPFCCAWDGCGAQFVLKSQHDGKAIYDQLVKDAENVFKNRLWSGATSTTMTLQQHTGLHRKAYTTLTITKCARTYPLKFRTIEPELRTFLVCLK
jgi:hypothetical protein